MCAIDPTRRRDVSAELEQRDGDAKPNPNSALVWQFPMDRSLANAAIHDGLCIASGRDGSIHCLDAQSGKHFWTHDAGASLYASPLIVDGKIYIGDEDGDLLVLELSRNKKVIAQHSFNSPIYASPVFANGVLYIMTSSHLYAISRDSLLAR
jgi:outer membrane protein assembly factor BamB